MGAKAWSLEALRAKLTQMRQSPILLARDRRTLIYGYDRVRAMKAVGARRAPVYIVDVDSTDEGGLLELRRTVIGLFGDDGMP